MKKIALGIYVVLITGCASRVWTKPGASQDEFSKVRYNCLRESQQNFAESQNAGFTGSASSGSKTNNLLFTGCMNSHGWYLQIPKEKDGNISEPKKVENVSEPKKIKAQPAAKPIAQTVEKKSEPTVAPQNTTPSPASTSMVATGNKAKIRKKPSTKADVVKTMKKGEEVRVIKQKDDWFQIELASGEVGWCHKSVLERGD